MLPMTINQGNEKRMLHVTFEQRPKENRTASIEKGHPVYEDVDFAIVTMPGGKQVNECEVTKELLDDWRGMRGGQYYQERDASYAVKQYEAWKEGQEAPVEGMDLRNWPAITPAQLKTCQMADIRSVEELAAMNDEAIRRVGIEARQLQNKARAYLENADSNKGAEQIAALMKEVELLTAKLEEKNEYIAELEKELEATSEPKPRRGRKPKAQEDES